MYALVPAGRQPVLTATDECSIFYQSEVSKRDKILLLRSNNIKRAVNISYIKVVNI
jgi:hypothetical protein